MGIVKELMEIWPNEVCNTINNWFLSKDMMQLLYDKIYLLHRLPLQIISDRGVQYSAKLFQEWYRILGIESTILTILSTNKLTNRMCKLG